MSNHKRGRTAALFALFAGLVFVFAVAACGGDGEAEPTATSAPAATEEPTDTSPTPTTAAEPTGSPSGEIAFDASPVTITIDGDSSDWDGIQGATVSLRQFELPAGVTFDDLDWDKPAPLDPVDAVLKVATDADNIYVLMEVPDDYDFVPDDHGRTASPNVMFLIDPDAGPHMGSGDDDFESGLGMVDIWHWEIDCGPGELSGGGGIPGGDDPNCNLDDEFSTNPEEREDDGGGDVANPDAENSIIGVWEHTARAEGIGAPGTWIFEMSRPLQTDDPQDAQFASGGVALIALAYYDADEKGEAGGWSAEGHLTSADAGWIEVTLP